MTKPMYTKEQLMDYLSNIKQQPGTPDGYNECADILQYGLENSGYLRSVIKYFVVTMLLMGPETASSSLWGTGFSMGVEFERRRREIEQLEELSK